MKKDMSRAWKSSKNPTKQRKYRINAPLHIRQKFVNVHLSKDLRKRFETRSLMPKKGDKVKIARGSNKGKIGKIEKVDLKRSKIFIEGIEVIRKDGNKSMIPVEPSNLILMEYNTEDKKRKKLLERKKKLKK